MAVSELRPNCIYSGNYELDDELLLGLNLDANSCELAWKCFWNYAKWSIKSRKNLIQQTYTETRVKRLPSQPAINHSTNEDLNCSLTHSVTRPACWSLTIGCRIPPTCIKSILIGQSYCALCIEWISFEQRWASVMWMLIICDQWLGGHWWSVLGEVDRGKLCK